MCYALAVASWTISVLPGVMWSKFCRRVCFLRVADRYTVSYDVLLGALTWWDPSTKCKAVTQAYLLNSFYGRGSLFDLVRQISIGSGIGCFYEYRKSIGKERLKHNSICPTTCNIKIRTLANQQCYGNEVFYSSLPNFYAGSYRPQVALKRRYLNAWGSRKTRPNTCPKTPCSPLDS